MDILLDDPLGNAWRNSKLSESIHHRLGTSYPYYESIIRRTNETLDELQDLLRIRQGQALALWERRDTCRPELELELRRSRIAFSKTKCNQISKLLEKGNGELAKLLQANDDLAPIRKRRQTGQNASLLQKLQHRAKHLHAALDGAWSCGCQSAHPVNLLLERRIKEKLIMEDYWRFYLSKYATMSQTIWQEIEVHMLEEDTLTERRFERPPNSTSHHALHWVKELTEFKAKQEATRKSLARSAIISATSIASAIAGQCTFSSPPLPSRAGEGPRNQVRLTRLMSPEVATLSSSQSSRPSDSKQMQHIQNMCTALNSADGPSTCQGFLKDGRNVRHALYQSFKQYLRLSSESKVTLHAALHKQAGAHVMSRQERLTIAATLASSLLQLHSTPWLHDHWTKTDIMLNHIESQGRIIPDPLLRADFHSTAVTSVNPRPPSSRIFNTKTALSGLGIMLLELCFGKPIEEHPSRKQYFGPDQKPNAFTDIATAREWHEEVLGEAGDEVYHAIRRCLDCSFAPKPSLDDKEFQEAVFDGVVLPLQEFLSIWQST
ncbi:MAG: hypothetical protein Q9160_007319 [Pyrenula sp. 1 TL-2023]